MEKYYLVRVVETLARTVKVKADSIDDAFNIVEKEYGNGKIVLDYYDFEGVEYYPRDVRDENLELYEEVKSTED